MVEYLDHLEVAVCRRINALGRRSYVRSFFSAVSRLGDYPAWVIFGLICLFQQGANAPVFVAHTGVTAIAGVLVTSFSRNGWFASGRT